MNAPLRVFIGYDSKEPVSFAVLCYSILRHATHPVTITPLTRQSVAHLYTREKGPTESTEFSLTRFLVPALSDFQGYSLFMDCDMLCKADINDVMVYPMAYPGKAVYVCKHEYEPKALQKFDGHIQTSYPRKNWTSFMLFDNAKCKALTPDFVNHATGLQLHRLQWLNTDDIGDVHLKWNWLVGEYQKNPEANVLHYTNGIPAFEGYESCDHADEWWSEYYALSAPMRLPVMAR